MRFDAPQPPHTAQRTSRNLGIHYWVDPNQVENYSAKKWKALDQTAENRYVHQLHMKCDLEKQQQRQMMEDAQGWFSVDQTKLNEARKMEKPNCKKMEELNIRL